MKLNRVASHIPNGGKCLSFVDCPCFGLKIILELRSHIGSSFVLDHEVSLRLNPVNGLSFLRSANILNGASLNSDIVILNDSSLIGVQHAAFVGGIAQIND